MDQKYFEEIKAREQAATVKIDRSREELVKLDVLGESALKSAKLMDLVVNGATLMSVNKDTLRGIIRVILTGAAAEVERLTEELHEEKSRRYQAECNYDHAVKDRDTLKKALETETDRALPGSTYSAKKAITQNLLEKCEQQLTHETHGNALEQAQEQEGKK